jgi:glycosyltransferase involved in cell wall biosynthesis
MPVNTELTEGLAEPCDNNPTRPCVIIPAHNEEASIARCLATLLADCRPGEFEVIVVCNGCTDRTGDIARSYGAPIRVIEIETGNKVLALNVANLAARGYPRLYLDADLEISTSSARRLFAAAGSEGVLAAIGRMELDCSGVGRALRQYYRVWSSHAYLAAGKFGGAYALSEAGCRLVGTLPRVTNDDEYVRRVIPAEGVRHVQDCAFVARMPRTFADLLRVRRRVYRGNRELRQVAGMEHRKSAAPGSQNSLVTMLRRHAAKPSMWPGLILFVAVNLAARVGSGTQGHAWGRDESTRSLKGARGT